MKVGPGLVAFGGVEGVTLRAACLRGGSVSLRSWDARVSGGVGQGVLRDGKDMYLEQVGALVRVT